MSAASASSVPTANGASPSPRSTQAVHAGEARYRAHDSLIVPIVQTSVYTFRNTGALVDYLEERMFWDEPEREEYGRYGNPTVAEGRVFVGTNNQRVLRPGVVGD
jgi:O-acetylhomoserine/O-acetylserine sulfhydrylase-like pyridoxal-dependent enzyme